MAGTVYMLRTEDERRPRTYIGATVCVERRLRQHNGELSGGGAGTRGRRWGVFLAVGPFPTWNDALRFEFAWRRCGRTVRRWDVAGRVAALQMLLAKERWSSSSPAAADVPLTLVLRQPCATIAALPPHITLIVGGSGKPQHPPEPAPGGEVPGQQDAVSGQRAAVRGGAEDTPGSPRGGPTRVRECGDGGGAARSALVDVDDGVADQAARP